MGFSFAHLTRWLLLAGMALAAVFSAEAQHSGRRPGQAILFSSPDGDDISSNVPSLTAKPPGLLDLENTEQPSGLGFGDTSQTGLLPEPQVPTLSPDQARKMQRQADERKNWALLTPEEIMGLPTPEKILAIPAHDAYGRPKNETVVAQYYERQEQSRPRTNDYNYDGRKDSMARWGLSDSQELRMNPNIWSSTSINPENPALMNSSLNGTSDTRAGSATAPNSGWLKSFNLPAPPPGPTPEEKTAMEQFQQLLQPHSLPGGTTKNPGLGSPLFSPASIAPAPGQPVSTPVGASYTPLGSGIATPTGANPLPGLFGPTNAAAPLFTPAWKPQTPPWMSDAPQPGVVPQRKF
jgi:hypothetical protein